MIEAGKVDFGLYAAAWLNIETRILESILYLPFQIPRHAIGWYDMIGLPGQGVTIPSRTIQLRKDMPPRHARLEGGS